MKSLMSLIACGVIALIFIISPQRAIAAEHILTISTWGSKNHPVNSRLWPQFIERLEELSDGKVTAEIVYDLAKPSDQLDLVEDGRADIGWVFHGYHPERFPSAKLMALPGFKTDAETLSPIFWRTYLQHFRQTDNYGKTVPIGMMTQGPGQLHTRTPVSGFDAAKGLKVRLTGDVVSRISDAFGFEGVHIPSAQINAPLNDGSIDGLFMPMGARRDFTLNEQLPYVLEIPGGFYRSTFAIIMRRTTLRLLSDDIKRKLIGNLFGDPLSTLAGEIWDQSDAIGIAATKASPGNRIHPLSADEYSSFAEVVETLRAETKRNVAKAGVNAASALDFISSEIARAQENN